MTAPSDALVTVCAYLARTPCFSTDFLGFHFSFIPPNQTAPMTFIFTGYFTPGVLVGPTRADAYVLRKIVASAIAFIARIRRARSSRLRQRSQCRP